MSSIVNRHKKLSSGSSKRSVSLKENNMSRDTYNNSSTNQLSSSWDEFLDSLHVLQWEEPTGQNITQELDNNPHQLEYYIIDESSSDLPPFMLCQPCQPDMENKGIKISQDPCDEIFVETGDYSTMREVNDEVFSLMLCQPCQPGQEERVISVASHPSSKSIITALPYTTSFASGIRQPLPEGKQHRPNERICYGHKEAIFGLEFSPCGEYMATASQDSTIRIWDVHQHRLLQTLTAHDAAYECLRVTWASKTWGDKSLDREGKHKYVLATGGADGVVKLWSAERPEGYWTCHDTLDHASFENKSPSTPGSTADPPQIYSLQFINHWKGTADETYQSNAFLLTSSDDFVHLWEVIEEARGSEFPVIREYKLIEVMSFHFTSLEDVGFGVTVTDVTNTGQQRKMSAYTRGVDHRDGVKENKSYDSYSFGGARNPQNIVYVFDAQYCQANGLLGVALSDGSLRIVNGLGVCLTPVALPSARSHLTSFSWDAKGQRIATCLASGILILWDILISQDQTSIWPYCRAVLEGGHVPGRPLYGAKFCGVDNSSVSQSYSEVSELYGFEDNDDSEELILSWGVDGRLCLWDSKSDGNVRLPLSTLISDPQYSLYSVDVTFGAIDVNSKDGNVAKNHQEGKEAMNSQNGQRIATIGCGGGGQGDPGFLGVPVYLYDVKTS